MGVSVRQKKSGEYWIFIRHEGRRKAKKIGRDKRKALEVAKEIEKQLALRAFKLDVKGPEVPSFGTYCQLWLDGYIKTTKRASTRTRYESLFVNHIFPVIGKIPLDKLKRSDIRDLLLKLSGKGLSRSTVTTAKNVISGTLEHAIDDEILTANVSKGVLRKLGLDTHQGREVVNSLTPEETELVLEACRQREPRWYPLFLTAFRTGMRLGELLALEWGDIDLSGRFIMVRRSFRSQRLTPTKTGKVRRVDISDQLHAELSRLLTRSKADGLAAGLGAAPMVVFHTGGKNTSQNSVRNVWTRVLSKAGLCHRRFHDIRHSYASNLLSTGASVVYVKEQLGHSSIQITVDIYGHLIPGSNREIVNRLDGAEFNN